MGTDPLVTIVNILIGAFFGLIGGMAFTGWFLARSLGEVVVRVLEEMHREKMAQHDKLQNDANEMLRKLGIKGH